MSLIKFTLYYKQNLEKIPKAIWKDQWRSKLLIQDSCKARYIFSSEKILFWFNFQPQRRHLRFLWRGTKNVVKQRLSRHFLLKNSYKSVKKIHPIITFNCSLWAFSDSHNSFECVSIIVATESPINIYPDQILKNK